MNKVINKPVIKEMNTDLIEVKFEFESKVHVINIHSKGSLHEFHASRTLRGVESSVDRTVAYLNYISILVQGWSDDSNDFFGGPYSYHHVRTICLNPENIWFVSAIAEKLAETEKK
ncbi:conserved hypothetical protein [Vibrio chagasii]|nr:conserved hypothetical protein [Vibrio chagasii]CAH7303335.1 conserved hypothetical protein [Vibrio chagasii]